MVIWGDSSAHCRGEAKPFYLCRCECHSLVCLMAFLFPLSFISSPALLGNSSGFCSLRPIRQMVFVTCQCPFCRFLSTPACFSAAGQWQRDKERKHCRGSCLSMLQMFEIDYGKLIKLTLKSIIKSVFISRWHCSLQSLMPFSTLGSACAGSVAARYPAQCSDI